VLFRSIQWFRRSWKVAPTHVWSHGIRSVFRYATCFLLGNNGRRLRGFFKRGQPLRLLSTHLWPNRIRATIATIGLQYNSDVQRIWAISNTHFWPNKPTIGFRSGHTVGIVPKAPVFWSACIRSNVHLRFERNLGKRFQCLREQQHPLWFFIPVTAFKSPLRRHGGRAKVFGDDQGSLDGYRLHRWWFWGLISRG